MIIVIILAILLALVPLFIGSFLDLFQMFLGYLGAVFPPCIAILLVDYYLLRKQKYNWKALGQKDGPYWYTNGVNWYAMVCWIVGAISYFVSMNFSFVSASIGSVFVCFIVTALLYFVLGTIFKSKIIREVDAKCALQ